MPIRIRTAAIASAASRGRSVLVGPTQPAHSAPLGSDPTMMAVASTALPERLVAAAWSAPLASAARCRVSITLHASVSQASTTCQGFDVRNVSLPQKVSAGLQTPAPQNANFVRHVRPAQAALASRGWYKASLSSRTFPGLAPRAWHSDVTCTPVVNIRLRVREATLHSNDSGIPSGTHARRRTLATFVRGARMNITPSLVISVSRATPLLQYRGC